METLPSAPEAERDLVGAVLYDELAFERAGLKSGDFYIQRWRWVWEACEKIKAADDHIDLETLEKELEKAGRLKDVTSQGGLMDYFVPSLLHVEANARLVREMAERRRIIVRNTELVRKAMDTNSPLPHAAGPAQDPLDDGGAAQGRIPRAGRPDPRPDPERADHPGRASQARQELADAAGRLLAGAGRQVPGT